MSKTPDQMPWTFQDIPANTAELSAQLRLARAAEYTAHYLSRIDKHLERIADAMGQGYPKINVLSELQQIRAGLTK